MSIPLKTLIHISLLRLVRSQAAHSPSKFVFPVMALELGFYILAEKIFGTYKTCIHDLLRYAIVLDVEEASTSADIS